MTGTKKNSSFPLKCSGTRTGAWKQVHKFKSFTFKNKTHLTHENKKDFLTNCGLRWNFCHKHQISNREPWNPPPAKWQPEWVSKVVLFLWLVLLCKFSDDWIILIYYFTMDPKKKILHWTLGKDFPFLNGVQLLRPLNLRKTSFKFHYNAEVWV